MKLLRRTLQQFHIKAYHIKENRGKAQQKLASSIALSGRGLHIHLSVKSTEYHNFICNFRGHYECDIILLSYLTKF